MGKPWARYEQNYINHPKFLALTANAICLWLEGKNYCDMHQTDGFIPLEGLRTFRFNGAKSVSLLLRSCGLKPNGSAYAPLWEKSVVGLKMHDYLDHNDCRDEVLARIDASENVAEIRRAANRDRQQRFRDEQKTKADALRNANGNAKNTVTSRTPTETETETEREQKRTRVTDDLTDENGHPVAKFMRVIYPQLYAKVRHGASYKLNEARDFEPCVQLVETYGDRLPLILEYFLHMPPSKDVLNQPGTPRQLLHMAPMCDAELRQAGR